jgi:hypothetical protein
MTQYSIAERGARGGSGPSDLSGENGVCGGLGLVQGCSWVRMMCSAAHGIVVGKKGNPTNAKTTCRIEVNLNVREAFNF